MRTFIATLMGDQVQRGIFHPVTILMNCFKGPNALKAGDHIIPPRLNWKIEIHPNCHFCHFN